MRSIVLVLGLLFSIAVTPAQAALTAVTDPAALPATVTFTESFAGLPAGALAPVTASAGTAGEVVLTAPSGLFGSGTGILSTIVDEETITLSFAQPVIGFGVTGGIVDEFFNYLDGTLVLGVGTESESFAVAATGAAFAGILSDSAFTEATIALLGFDTGASSAAFLGLESATTVVPLPAAAPLLVTALAAMALLRRRR